jgi:hypothetical protein
MDMVIGTPEGVMNSLGVPKTYYPSLVHDVLYRIGRKLGMERAWVDDLERRYAAGRTRQVERMKRLAEQWAAEGMVV